MFCATTLALLLAVTMTALPSGLAFFLIGKLWQIQTDSAWSPLGPRTPLGPPVRGAPTCSTTDFGWSPLGLRKPTDFGWSGHLKLKPSTTKAKPKYQSTECNLGQFSVGPCFQRSGWEVGGRWSGGSGGGGREGVERWRGQKGGGQSLLLLSLSLSHTHHTPRTPCMLVVFLTEILRVLPLTKLATILQFRLKIFALAARPPRFSLWLVVFRLIGLEAKGVIYSCQKACCQCWLYYTEASP